MLRRRTSTRPLLSESLRRFLETGDSAMGIDAGMDVDAHAVFRLRRDETALRALWQDHRAELLAEFVAEHPGSCPWAWWRFEAPEPRRRLGGIGTPAAEVLAYAPEIRCGIPSRWVSEQDVAYYTGRAVDVHGCPIGQEFRGHDFRGVAIDPDDPPRFESEAAFLDRHGLLSAAERLRLPADAFEPELVDQHTDEEGK